MMLAMLNAIKRLMREAGLPGELRVGKLRRSALTNARFAPLHRLEIGPVALPTPPVPLLKSVPSSRAAT